MNFFAKYASSREEVFMSSPRRGRMDKAAIPHVDAHMVDLISGGTEKDQVAVHEVAPADSLADPELLPGGSRDIHTAEIVDGPDETAAVHPIHHGVPAPAVGDPDKAFRSAGGNCPHLSGGPGMGSFSLPLGTPGGFRLRQEECFEALQ